jgi:predicted DCC family thiol-disulfide oxidoreductase YuxK
MIVVFDPECLFCSRGVQLLLKHDHKKVLRFASIQSVSGSRLLAQAGLKVTALDTLLVISNGQSYMHTAALLRVLHELGWPWRALWLAWLIPAPLRDAAYRFIARHRYRLFGQPESCFVPSPNDRQRFLE